MKSYISRKLPVATRTTDLILVSLAGASDDVLISARSIRERAGVGELVPVVLFCFEGINEGDEVEIGENVHLTCPDNFNQLRSLIARLLNKKTVGSSGTVDIRF